MTSTRSTKTLTATLLLGAATPALALAATEAAPTDVLDTITVLASRIGNRTAFDSPVPVDVYTPAETLAALVTGDTGAALQALSPSVNMPRVSASGTSDAVRAIQLRGLAPDQTLVLINGKRRHTNAVMDFEGLFKGTVAVDLNTIPASAIDHLEILRDGAGAIYGSDAIAGVVNIVLKSGADAGSAEASFGEYRTHFAPTGTTITDGRNRTLDADTGFAIGEHGWLRIGATVQDRGATQRAGRSDAYWTSWNATDADVALNDQVVFRSGDPEVKNRGLFYNLSLPLGGAELYSFATVNQRKSRGAAFFRYPGDPTNVPAIYPNGFLPVSTNDGRDVGVVAGARGDAGAWHWDASVRDGYNTFNYGLSNTLNASLGAASPTSFHVADFTTEQRALNLDVTRSLPLGDARNLDLALGAEYLGERYHTSPGDPASYAAGPFFANEFGEPIPPGAQGDSGLRPSDTVHLKRDVTSLYLDADAEVLKGLNLGAAARYSDYSDYGSSTTGKFTLRYAIAGGVVLRGAISSSFRAPALAQTGIRFASLNFNGDGTGLANNAWLPPGDPIAVGLGATPLKPERSTNSTLGLAWRAAGTSASVDFYQIRIRDRITPTGALQSDGVSAYLAGAGATDIASVTFLTNALDTTTRGVDVVVSHEQPLFGGTLLMRAAFNHNSLTEDHQRSASAALAAIDPGLALLDPTVLVPLEYSSPKSKLILTADWSGARHGLRVQATRFGALSVFTYDDSQPTTPVGGNAQPYSPVWSIDVEGRASITSALEAAIGGTNVFNHYPDRTTAGGTYGGAFPYNYTHPLGINGAYFYARLRYRFGP